MKIKTGKKNMNWIKNISIGLVLSILSILLFFVTAEVVVRILSPEIIPTTAYDWSSRHKGYNLEKAPGTFRIVVLGDSYTFGQGVKRDETFPNRLERILHNRNGKIIFEVVNLGFCGLNTAGELQILSELGINPITWQPDYHYRGLAYKPDLILHEFTLNDSATSGRAMEQIKPFDDKWRTGEVIIRVNSGVYRLPIPESVDKFLTKNSRFYLFFMNRYNHILAKLGIREGGDSGIQAMLNRYHDDFEGWVNVRDSLAAMSNISIQQSVPVLLVVYPEMYKLKDYPFKDIHKKVLGVGNGLGFHTLDLEPSFEGLDDKSLRVSPFDGHPNAKAHDIAARAIAEFLIKERLVPLL